MKRKYKEINEKNVFSWLFSFLERKEFDIKRKQFGFVDLERKEKRRKEFEEEREKDFDRKYIKRDMGITSQATIREKKAECILSIFQLKPDPAKKGWYVFQPKESYVKSPLFQYNHRLSKSYFLPDCSSKEEAFNIIINNVDVSIYQNWVSVIDLCSATEQVFFIGYRDQKEPPCKCSESGEHDWDEEEYTHDMVHYEEGVCLKCGIKKTRVTEDSVGYKWNKNHGWRYLTKDNDLIKPEKEKEEEFDY